MPHNTHTTQHPRDTAHNNRVPFARPALLLGRLAVSLALLLTFTCPPAPAQADEPVLTNRPYQYIKIDLDSDGKSEGVALMPYNLAPNGHLGQLVIYDDDGQILWSGPRMPYVQGQMLRNLDVHSLMAHPLVFGTIPPHTIDIRTVNGPMPDGTFEIVAAEHARDGVPESFRVLTWDGAQVIVRFTEQHLAEDREHPDHFTWSSDPFRSLGYGYHDGRWVTALITTDKPTQFYLSILDIKRAITGKSRPVARKGKALARFEGNGYTIIRWIEPLQVTTEIPFL